MQLEFQTPAGFTRCIEVTEDRLLYSLPRHNCGPFGAEYLASLGLWEGPAMTMSEQVSRSLEAEEEAEEFVRTMRLVARWVLDGDEAWGLRLSKEAAAKVLAA